MQSLEQKVEGPPGRHKNRSDPRQVLNETLQSSDKNKDSPAAMEVEQERENLSEVIKIGMQDEWRREIDLSYTLLTYLDYSADSLQEIFL